MLPNHLGSFEKSNPKFLVTLQLMEAGYFNSFGYFENISQITYIWVWEMVAPFDESSKVPAGQYYTPSP